MTPSGLPSKSDSDFGTATFLERCATYQSALDRWFITWIVAIVLAGVLLIVGSAIAAVVV